MIIECKSQWNGDVKKIKVQGDKEKEVTVGHESVPPKWKTWNDDNLPREWNKTYFTKKRK